MKKHAAWGPFSRDSLRRSLHRACDSIGVPRIRPYDLRHSIATAVYDLTGDIRAVQSLLDHSDLKMTNRYMQGAVDTRLRAALKTVGKATKR
jgi:integrase